MKHLIGTFFLILLPYIIYTQNLEVEGSAKISEMATDNTAQFLVVRQADGTLALREISSLPDGDSDATNEIQDLNLFENILTITNNGTATSIDLSGFLDNTDDQTFDVAELDGTNLELSLESDNEATKVIDLSSLQDGTGTDNQTLTLNVNDLSISNGNMVDLSPFKELPATATMGDVLTWDGSNWIAQAGGSGGGDDLGNHTATQPLQLVSMTTAQRDNIMNPTPGMLIYNSDSGRTEFFQELPPNIYIDLPNNGNTETGCTSIAQSFSLNATYFINEIETKIDFNGGMGDVTVKIFDSDGTGGTELLSEVFTFASIPVQNGNEYNFILTNPLFVNCCPTITFEITQAGNTNMTAHIDFQNMTPWDSNGGTPAPGYAGGKFYKDGMNSDVTDTSGFPIVIFTSKDLDFKVVTQRKQWVQ